MNEKESTYITKALDDHENRIRSLEQSTLELKYQLSDIQKSQTEIKLSINESQNKLLNTITKVLDTTIYTDNKIKLTDRKEFWGVIVTIVGIGTSIITYFCNK